MLPWRNAVAVYRDRGLHVLLRKTAAYVQRLLLLTVGSLYLRLVPPLPQLRVSKSAGPATGQFLAANTKEYPRIIEAEPQLVEFVSCLRPDDVIFDIGANIGIYTMLAADVLDGGSVYAFEPLPANAERLTENVRLNDAPVEVFEYAFAAENGRTDLKVPDTVTGEGKGSIVPGSPTADRTTVTVRTRRADDLVAEEGVPVPNVVKIDVEGAELAVLEGMDKVLVSEECRLVYCEVHSPPGETREVESLLAEAGFGVTRVAEKPNGYWVRANK